MQKLGFILSFFLLGGLASCHGDHPVEQTTLDAGVATLTDAATAASLSHTHNADGHTHTLVCSFVIAAQAADASAQSIGTYQITTPRFSPLPEPYVLQNNPFEIVGNIHNKSLKLINEMGGGKVVYDEIKSNNKEMWGSFFSIDNSFPTSDDMNAAMADANNHQLTAEDIKLIDACLNAKTSDEIIALVPLSTASKAILKDVSYKYLDYVKNKSEASTVLNYINSVINPYLTKEILTDDETEIVVFLTVLKHSYYYWNI